jgi:phospholipid/cholesterol/gamma-HCH transport system substrate-binding protein
VITAIKKNLVNFLAIIGLIVIAGVVSVYILSNQRLRFPLVEEKPFVVNAEFSTAQAVTAGQGQTIRVAGVRIGDIGAVELKDGRAVVQMLIDPEYADMIHTDARAMLRPKTGLKDMFVDLEPGSDDAPLVKEEYTIPIASTLPDVNPDEIFSALDADTRDYLKLLVNGAGRGLEGRGGDLREVFRRFEPTHRDLALVNQQVAKRRENLRRLIRNLNLLNGELARNDDDLAKLISESSTALSAFAQEEANISDAVGELPSAPKETTGTLTKVERLGKALGPAAQALRPAARALDDANEAIAPFAREAAPLLREDIRPFVRESRPIAQDLRPSARRLARATPDLEDAIHVLNRFVNMAAFNPNGREPKEDDDRQEGYLFWAAWLQHIGASVFSTADAHGSFRPVTLAAPCQTFKQIVAGRPELEFLLGVTPLITDNELCNP